MNIAFVNYYDFSSNSAIHIFYLTNALCSAGRWCCRRPTSGIESGTGSKGCGGQKLLPRFGTCELASDVVSAVKCA
jgi:hypothetical protein